MWRGLYNEFVKVEDRSLQESSYRIKRVLESQYRERQWRYLVEIEGLLTPIWLKPEFVPNIMLQEFEVRCIREVSGAIVGINVDDNDSEPDAYDPETPLISRLRGGADDNHSDSEKEIEDLEKLKECLMEVVPETIQKEVQLEVDRDISCYSNMVEELQTELASMTGLQQYFYDHQEKFENHQSININQAAITAASDGHWTTYRLNIKSDEVKKWKKLTQSSYEQSEKDMIRLRLSISELIDQIWGHTFWSRNALSFEQHSDHKKEIKILVKQQIALEIEMRSLAHTQSTMRSLLDSMEHIYSSCINFEHMEETRIRDYHCYASWPSRINIPLTTYLTNLIN